VAARSALCAYSVPPFGNVRLKQFFVAKSFYLQIVSMEFMMTEIWGNY
jgi:hypothetical protein